MNKIILAALLIALVSCGIQKSPARLSDTKTVLAEMDKEPFGSTMISAVALSAATNNPVEEITLFIEEIIETLNNEQAAADDKNRTDEAVCDETIASLKNQIVETQDSIDSTTKAIEIHEDILASAKVSLAQADADYEETVQKIIDGTEQRQQEHSRWADEDYNNQIEIATLEEGVKLINHMIHGVAFTQIKVRYEKVMDKLKDETNKHSSLFKPLISSLTQLATKLNYENVIKILDLLNNIRISIVEERELNRINEEKAQADWVKLLNHLTSEKQRLSNKRATLRTLIEQTENLLVQLRASLETNKFNLEQLNASLTQQEATCAQQSNTYITESDERARELNILGRLLDHINEKFAQVQEYTRSRVYEE